MTPKNFHSKKRFGQNFLKDEIVINKIISSLEFNERQPSLEIGPGFGALTKNLINISNKVLAIEIDCYLAGLLKEKFKNANNLTVLNQDILEFDFKTLQNHGEKWLLVGNLPYNIATQIILRALAHSFCFKKIIVMVQHEVAQRITATPRTKSYGRLSINIQRKADIFVQQIVRPECFTPIPLVNSAVIEITPKTSIPDSELDLAVERITKMAFNKRRKTILNALKPIFDRNDYEKCGINPKTRPEELSIGQYESLAKYYIISGH